MAGHVIRFRTRERLLREEHAAALRQYVLTWEGVDPSLVRQFLLLIDRNTAASKGFTFVMLSPDQNFAVQDWILDHAKRPRVSTRLWAAMFRHLRLDTGEVMMDRQQMMDVVADTSAHVSTALNELVKIGALIRRQEGREVRWFMNPTIGTKLTGVAREKAQSTAPKLHLAPVA